MRNRVRGPTQCGIIALTMRCTKGGCKLDDGRRMPGAGLSCCRFRKAPLGKPAFQPYWGKPAVRNDREDRGNGGIIRSPLRVSILPDYIRVISGKAQNEHITSSARDRTCGSGRWVRYEVWSDTCFPSLQWPRSISRQERGRQAPGNISSGPSHSSAIDFRFLPLELTSRCSQLIKAHHGAKGYWNLPDLLWHEETREFIAKQANLPIGL